MALQDSLLILFNTKYQQENSLLLCDKKPEQ